MSVVWEPDRRSNFFFSAPECHHMYNLLKYCCLWRVATNTHSLNYRGWLNFLRVPIFVVFVEGPIHEFQCPRNSDFLYELWRKILWPRNFEPHEYLIFLQSMKIGTLENKAIQSSMKRVKFIIIYLVHIYTQGQDHTISISNQYNNRRSCNISKCQVKPQAYYL